MKILPVVDNRNRNKNINFGSSRVPSNLIEDFQIICPKTHSLSDVIRTKVNDYGTGVIESIARRITGVPQGENPTSLNISRDVFIDNAEYEVFVTLNDAIKAAMKNLKIEDAKNIFIYNWKKGIGTIGALKAQLLAFEKYANPVKPENIKTFMPLAELVQTSFLAQLSKK